MSGLRPSTQGLLPEQLGILGSAPFYTTFQPIGSAPLLSCFIGIPGQDQDMEDNCSLDFEDIGLAEGE